MKKLMYVILLLSSVLFCAGNDRYVYIGVIDATMTPYNFSAAPYDYVTFKAWIQSRPTEVINQTSIGSGYEDFDSGVSAVCLNAGSFPTPWSPGDVLVVLLKESYDDYGGCEASCTVTLDNSFDGILIGLDDWFGPGTSTNVPYEPISINTPDHSHELYYALINVVDNGGVKFDFSSEPYDNVTFQCWISGREDEIIDQNSERSGYMDFGYDSAISISSYDFKTYWNFGDTLYVSIRHDTPGLGYYTGIKKYIFTYTSTTDYWDDYIDFGFEGDPVFADSLIEDPRTISYECITTDSTSYNFIALPYDAGFAEAGDLDPEGENLNAVGSWIRGEGVWQSAVHHPYFGWINNFDVRIGQPYMINAINSFNFTVTGDSVQIPPYEFIPSVVNSFMIPLNRTSAQDTRDIWDEPGFDISSLFGYNSENQNWNSDGVDVTPTPFAIYPGMAMLGYSYTTFLWPVDKKQSDIIKGEKVTKENFKTHGRFTGPKALILHIADENGNDFDLSSSTVTFKAWIEGNEYDVITQDTPGSSLMTLKGMSVCYIETSRFWDVFLNDNIVVVVQDESTENYEDWTIGSATYSLGMTGDPLFKGFEDVLPGTGEPVSTTEPSGLNFESIPSETVLSQNYPNPFNPKTEISFSLPKEELVKLSVFNTKGELVKELVNGKVSAGNHRVNFNAENLNSGIYFYSLETGSTKLSKKMLLVK